MPAGQLAVWGGEERAVGLWCFQTAAIWRKQIRFLNDSEFLAHIRAIASRWDLALEGRE